MDKKTHRNGATDNVALVYSGNLFAHAPYTICICTNCRVLLVGSHPGCSCAVALPGITCFSCCKQFLLVSQLVTELPSSASDSFEAAAKATVDFDGRAPKSRSLLMLDLLQNGRKGCTRSKYGTSFQLWPSVARSLGKGFHVSRTAPGKQELHLYFSFGRLYF